MLNKHYKFIIPIYSPFYNKLIYSITFIQNLKIFMKVINLLGQDFHLACENLSFKIKENFVPNVIIGVLTGGGIIGREIFSTFENIPNCHYTEVKLQRGTTKVKEVSNAKKILKHLPEWILNIMRIIEVELLELKAKFIKPHRYGTISLDDDIQQILLKKGKRILIIDDCIDTGWTLKLIKEYIEMHFPGNEIKIAVFTTAHRKPVIRADFQLYNRTLIRFPWAYDTKSSNS